MERLIRSAVLGAFAGAASAITGAPDSFTSTRGACVTGRRRGPGAGEPGQHGEAASGRHPLEPDDVFGDVEGALNAGIDACLVRTGKYRPGDESRVAADFPVVDSITEAVALALA